MERLKTSGLSLLLLLLGGLSHGLIYIYPTNYIEKKGETIGIIFEETKEFEMTSLSIENKIFYPFYRLESNIVYSLIGIPHTILTDFNLVVGVTNRETGDLINFEIPFYVNINPLTYAKRKPREIREIKVENSFDFKTTKFRFLPEYKEDISFFIRPAEGQVKDGYGVNRSRGGILQGRIHLGIDILREWGAKVKPTHSGVVILTSRDRKAGNYIVIYHGYGICSLYMHLSKILVKKGQIVTTNDTIGLVGSTGRSTGPHLHFGISVNNIHVDPISFLERDYSPLNIISNGLKIKIQPIRQTNLNLVQQGTLQDSTLTTSE